MRIGILGSGLMGGKLGTIFAGAGPRRFTARKRVAYPCCSRRETATCLVTRCRISNSSTMKIDRRGFPGSVIFCIGIGENKALAEGI